MIPKARPRFSNGHAYTQSNYRLWKSEAVAIISKHFTNTITDPVSIEIILIGFKQGDADNLAGAVLDALVDAGLLQDDRIALVPKLSIEHLHSTTVKGAFVAIAPYKIKHFHSIGK